MRKMLISRYVVSLFLIPLIMLSNVAHADGMRVYYVHKKNGSHIGYQVWEGTRTEHKELSGSIVNMLMDQYQLDSVTVAPMYANRCGVLYSSPLKDGKIKYYFSEYHKSLEKAQVYAKDKSDNKYGNYKVLDVACSPDVNKLHELSDGSINCPNGPKVNYKFIIPPKPTKRVAVILRGGGANIVFSEKDLNNINVDKVASSICPGKERPISFIQLLGNTLVKQLNEMSHESCVEKHGSEEGCSAWKRQQVKRNSTYLSGVRG